VSTEPIYPRFPVTNIFITPRTIKSRKPNTSTEPLYKLTETKLGRLQRLGSPGRRPKAMLYSHPSPEPCDIY
jgi:hypothetical protein